MNVPFVQDVKNKLKQVQKDLAFAQAKVDDLRKEAAALSSLVDLYSAGADKAQESEPLVLSLEQNTPPWTGLTQAEACYRAVLEAGKPITRHEIYSILYNNGVKVKNAKTLSPTLSTHKKLQHLGDGLWTTK